MLENEKMQNIETFTIEIKANGNFTEQELKDYIIFELRGGSLDSDNPFISDDCEANIIDCDIY